jgi:mRNA interferase RelE/StbE
MIWHIRFTPKAERQLSKMDRAQSRIITAWLEKNIEGCENPRIHGRGLVENHSGEWRYQIGNYRVLCEIQDDKLVVLAFNIDHSDNTNMGYFAR